MSSCFTVVRRIGRRVSSGRTIGLYLLRAPCGNTIKRASNHLSRAHRCACVKRPSRGMNLVGRRFGRFVVLRELEPVDGKRWWECRCDCGRVWSVVQSALLRGAAKSCGCAKAFSPGRTPRKMVLLKGEPVTISECARRSGLSRDVIEQRLGLGWPIERAMNVPVGGSRRSVYVCSSRLGFDVEGERLTITQCAERAGMNRDVLDSRLRRGWPLERAMEAPVRPVKRRIAGV